MWTYRAAVLQVIDGDTLRLEVDLGFHVHTQQDIRLLGVSAPEHNQPGGAEATAFVQAWLDIDVDETERWPFLVTTVLNAWTEPEEKRTFTRYLGTVEQIDTGRVLNADLRNYLQLHPEWGTGI